MHFMNLFLVACFYLALPIVYAMLLNAAKERNNLILAVTLPPEGRKDPEVAAVQTAFRKKLTALFVLLTVALLPLLFVPWVSVVTLVCCIWLIAALVLPYVLFGKANTALKAMKRRRGWQTAAAPQTVVEMPPAKPMHRASTLWFLPPVLLSALPLLSLWLDSWDPSWNIILGITAGMCVFITAMSLAFYPLVYRQRLDALDADRSLTAALTRVRRYNWTKCWLLMAYLTAGYSLAVWLCRGSMGWFYLWTAVYTVALLFVSIQTEFAARRAQRRLTLGRTTVPAVDEDDYWVWGLFYYNPHNTHFLVNERVGMGMSMNLARPAAKCLLGFTALIIALLPLLGVWLMVEEFSPLTLQREGETIVARQALTTYRVDLADVTDSALLPELPDATRIAGTGLDNLLKGSFSVEGYGMVKLCLNPNDPPFLVLETEKTTYILGGDGVEALYAAVSEVSYD